MNSDSSGNLIANIDSLQINNQTVLDKNLNLNVLSVNSNQYKIGDITVLDNNLNLTVASINTAEFNTNALDANAYKIGGQLFVDNSLNLDVQKINSAELVTNNISSATGIIGTLNANAYKIGGQIFVDNSLNLNVQKINSSEIVTNNVSSTIGTIGTLNANAYKIGNKTFVDNSLNLDVNSLISNTITTNNINIENTLTTNNINVSNITMGGKLVIDDKKNFNIANITAFSVNTSSLSINGKPCIDKSLNINASSVTADSLFIKNSQIIDTSGNFTGNIYSGSQILPNIKLSYLSDVTSNIQTQINTKANTNNASLTGLTQIEKILEKITPITLSGTTYNLDYSTLSSNTLYCNSISGGDLTLNISNLSITGSGSITLTILLNTTTHKNYFKTIKINNVVQSMVGINGANNLTIDTNATLILQQFTFVYINSSLLKIIASLSSLL